MDTPVVLLRSGFNVTRSRLKKHSCGRGELMTDPVTINTSKLKVTRFILIEVYGFDELTLLVSREWNFKPIIIPHDL